MFLLKLFGSKKLIAALAAIIAGVAVPFLNKKLGAGLDPVEVAGTLSGVFGVALAYILAQYRIDISTAGDTTTTALLGKIAAGETGPVSASVIAALKLASALLPEGPGKMAVSDALDELGA